MFLISKKWLLTRLFDLRNSRIRRINSTEWVYGKVDQSYLIINWVLQLLIISSMRIRVIISVDSLLITEFSHSSKFLLCGKEREGRNLAAIQLQAISYHIPHTEARLASLEKVHKVWRSKWGLLSYGKTSMVCYG